MSWSTVDCRATRLGYFNHQPSSVQPVEHLPQVDRSTSPPFQGSCLASGPGENSKKA